MEEYIMEIMKRASAFLVLAQAVVHFRPNPSYEKYFKFLVGIMTIVILVIPLMELLHRDLGGQYAACMSRYTEKMQEMTEQGMAMTVTSQEIYLEEMAEEIGARLEPYAAEQGYGIEKTEILGIRPDGETGEEDVRVRIRMRPKGSVLPAIEIEEIRLEEGTDEAREASGKEEAFRKAFAELLEMEESRLEVKIIE